MSSLRFPRLDGASRLSASRGPGARGHTREGGGFGRGALLWPGAHPRRPRQRLRGRRARHRLDAPFPHAPRGGRRAQRVEQRRRTRRHRLVRHLHPVARRRHRHRAPAREPVRRQGGGLHLEHRPDPARVVAPAGRGRVPVQAAVGQRAGQRPRHGAQGRDRGQRGARPAAPDRRRLAGPRGGPDRPRVRGALPDHPGPHQRPDRRAHAPVDQLDQVLHPLVLPQDQRRQPLAGRALGCRPRHAARPGPGDGPGHPRLQSSYSADACSARTPATTCSCSWRRTVRAPRNR